MSLDLDAIKARCEAATSGPWVWEVDSGMLFLWKDMEFPVTAAWRCTACEDRDAPCMWPKEADAAFIAAARSDVPALVAEVEHLRAELVRVRDLVGEIDSDLIDEVLG